MKTSVHTSILESAFFLTEFLTRKEFTEGYLWSVRKQRTLKRHADYSGEEPADIKVLDKSVTPEQLQRATKNYHRPAIIRGLMTDDSAVKKWVDSDYLAKTCGESLYRVVNGATDDDRLGRDLIFGKATVGDLLSGISSGHESRYLAGVSDIFIDHPELLDDLNLPKIRSLFGVNKSRKRFDGMNMFIGGPGTRSRIHCAFAGNFFFNVVGRKRWRILAPEYRHLLLPIASRPFIYASSYFDPLDDTHERSDFARKLPFFDVTLEPGDVLYNAPWWWHQVENLEPLNIACAIRVGQFWADFANNLTYTLLSMQPRLYALRCLYLLKNLFDRNDGDFRTDVLRFLHNQQLKRTLNQGRK